MLQKNIEKATHEVKGSLKLSGRDIDVMNLKNGPKSIGSILVAAVLFDSSGSPVWETLSSSLQLFASHRETS